MDEKGLGAHLQEVRRQKGFTQQTLCQRAGLSYSTLAKIERGAIKAPSIFTIQRISEVLGVTLDELLGLQGATPARTLKRSKSGVTFVYFDVNGCLIRGYQRAFTALAHQSGASPDIIETLFWRYNDDVNSGTMSLTDFNQALSQRIGAEVDWGQAYLDAVEPVKEMQELVHEVAGQYRVGLFTNSMPGLIGALRSKGLLPQTQYDVVVDSSEIGAIKPESKAYRIATERAGCPPGEILLVDDTRGNIVAAEKADWHVLMYDGTEPHESLERIRTALEPAS
jgi:putative hydrolase of the HAD superfamily